MEADVPVKKMSLHLPLNPCCSLWKEKCSKLEAGRKHLRQAVQILNQQVDKFQADNNSLKNSYEEEKMRAASEKLEKEKELAARVALENEIIALKSEISSLKQKGSADAEVNIEEVKVLKDNVSKAEKEIVQLKGFLEKEKIRADSEKKNAEAQKKSASEAWKLMKAEKFKADEERKLAISEGKKAEEYRLQLEGLRKQVEEAEMDKSTKEQKRADLEMAKAEEQRKLAEANGKKFIQEKSRADNLSQQLEDARKKIEELQKKVNNLASFRNLDSRYHCDQNKIPASSSEISSLQKGSLDIEDKTRELKLFQDCISEGEKQINCLKALIEKEKEKADYMKKNAKEEKKRAAEAWKCAEAEKKHAAKAWKCARAEKARADEEKKNADIEWKKAQNYRIQLEASEKEADETKENLLSKISHLEKATKELEKEKYQKFEEVIKTHRKEAEEQRKLVEANKEMALEEKSRADQLACQLEESRHKIEELQKQILELLSSKKAVDASSTSPDKVRNAESSNLKLLEKQLKLEKMRLKYAKQMTKLEKNRNFILQKELGRIQMDSIQISQRLGALDKWLSSGVECRENSDKEANIQRSKLKRKLRDLESIPMYAQTESELFNSSRMALAASDPLRKTLYCNPPFSPVSGANCTASISGINSKLKSLDGGSFRKLLLSSAMNSSSASFSDGQSVGSQEHYPFVSTISEKQLEEKYGPATSCMSGEVTKAQFNENLAMVAENSVRSPHSVDTFRRVNGHSRKFNRVLDAIESVEILYSEGKKLHVQMEEKLSALHGMLNSEIDKPVEESKHMEAIEQDDGYANHKGGFRKRKEPCDERTILQHFCSIYNQEKATQMGNDAQDNATARTVASPSDINRLGVEQDCAKGLDDSFASDLNAIERVEEVENGDYMKLLDLDNAAEEECYRIAMEMPLSPTLPEIEFSSIEIFDTHKFKVGDNFNEGLPIEKEVLVPSQSFDTIGVEINSNNVRCHALGTLSCDIPHENGGLVDSFDLLGNQVGNCITVQTEGTSNRQTRDSVVIAMPNVPCSGVQGQKPPNILSETKLGLPHDNIPAFCVVLSNTNDLSVSRIFSATRNCAVRCSFDTERERMVEKILLALELEENILPKEKACALFTLLLLNFPWYASLKSGSFSDEFALCLDSFACQIKAVVSDVEARSLFVECGWDELVGLIEDFLINGQLMYSDASSETSGGCDSSLNIFLDGRYLSLFSKPSSADQLVAGSIILASICAATEHIKFIDEVSYNLLRIRKYDPDVLLTILHVFAYLGGKKFFTLKENNLTITALKAIIAFLEGENSSVSSASCLSSSHEVRSKFHPCAKCPFDAVSVDMAISLLLEKLHFYALTVTMDQHLTDSANVPNSHVLCHKDNAKQSSSHEQILGALDVNCGSSCGLNNHLMPSTDTNSVSGNLFDLTDVLSLVELVACYMSWEWTCGKVIPVLLEILEKPLPDDFAVAVILLLGQLGRFGVAACGCEDKEIEGLKSKFSGFFGRNATIGASLPVQIATITSLLGFLCLNFEDVVHGDLKLSEVGSRSIYIDLIRKWFSVLSKEQQSLSYSLLKSTAKTAS